MSEYVIMPKADYVAACDAIREKTGKTDLIKSGDMESEILGIESGRSDVPFTTITVTAKRAGVVLPGATVTAVNGSNTVTGVTGTDGTCKLIVTVAGTWTITVAKDGGTSTTSTYVSLNTYTATATLFYATITICCETGASVALEYPDGTVSTETATSERTVFTVYSSGTYTATVTYSGINKTETITVSTTTGQKYQVNLYTTHLDLEETSWTQISVISEEGNAANYFAVGDTKSVTLNGTVGSLSVNATYYVYIIGINHNASFEGNGIHFGCFKTADGTDIALVDSNYGYAGTDPLFRHNASSSTNWTMSFLRKNILGSTGTSKNVDSSEAPTAERSVSSTTLLGAIPSELLNVIKPVNKYVWVNSGNASNSNKYVRDYFSLLSYYEITGKTSSYTDANNTSMFDTYCKQYEYYANGASAIKYKHDSKTTACIYWIREQGDSTANYSQNLCISTSGAVTYKAGNTSYGLAPIFVV